MYTQNEILWKSRTSGHKTVTMLLTCLAVLVLSLVGGVISSSKDNDVLKIVLMIIAVLAIIACLVTVCLAKLTDLKWNVSNLIFFLTEDGFYFTGVVNQDSYFYAEWSEIVGYSVTTGKNGKATVTVNFNGIADAGSYGKIKHLKMVGILGVEELCKIFETHGINQIEYSKNIK
ncbi:MAG: hypothetical protein K2I46_03690 [Clostridia bacterium]|nr:hypothetical protein [Clostridia bacterium]MDE6472505.1 hypothetical protein [Clostridia bacterium]